MSENIKLEIVTPDKIVVDETTQIAVAPGTLGEFGVLKGHTPFMTTLKIGTMRYQDSENKEQFVFVNGGFAEALPDKLTILTESAEKKSDIDVDRAKKAADRANERISAEKKSEIDFVRAKLALSRALQRLKTTGAVE